MPTETKENFGRLIFFERKFWQKKSHFKNEVTCILLMTRIFVIVNQFFIDISVYC